ncbi:unnamed protein product [Rhizophagus irregularis]|uniref:Protein kinase domain-containing protein n=1 Tax=Rhizophagus irregularis TaxID=588596 RepID=A0A915Z0Y1_9GLOM|nr:unnamed protein product [Rhizophagus irregularis]CAB5358073.1 unnamed protein product [Rhizophagus irregularis]
MRYASEGDLHKYLQNEFTEIKWQLKISILHNISTGLMNVHGSNFIHRDLHSGNILFSEKPHPKAIYTSRSLNSYISKCSSIFSKYSSINFSSNDYTSNDLEFDIDIKSKLNVIGTKRNIEELNNNSCENNRKRIKIN